MAKPPDKTRVRAGSVSLPLYRHPKGWRWAWKDPATGRWHYGTRRDRAEALAEAHRQALLLNEQGADLASALADPKTAAVVRRALAMEIGHADLDLLDRAREIRMTAADIERVAEIKTASVHPLGTVAAQFLAAKESARGPSRRNVQFLANQVRAILDHLGPDVPIAEISPDRIESWINHGDVTARTRKNRRGAAVTFWRWARSRRFLPDETTAAERAEQPIVVRGTPSTWTPAELRIMWDVCPLTHRPWMALSAWAGCRGEELYQDDAKSGKDVVRWRDVVGGHLEIRANVAKTGRRRIIPLRPALAAFLAEERIRRADEPDHAPICLGRSASRDLPVINRTPTSIIGEAVGGWKRNALRHSFISYRAAQVGIARAALEAGNSEAEAKRSYHDAMTEADAAAWFAPIGTSSEPLTQVEAPVLVAIR
jgi:hypothetical protein